MSDIYNNQNFKFKSYNFTHAAFCTKLDSKSMNASVKKSKDDIGSDYTYTDGLISSARISKIKKNILDESIILEKEASK